MIRYGDELGMGDDLTLPERNSVRTPMQWSTEPNAGFSKAKKTVVPVIHGRPYGYEKVNAADQRRDVNSMLNWTERMVRMRKELPELGWGDFDLLKTRNAGVLAVRYAWRNNAVLILHNLVDAPVEIELHRGTERGRRLVNLLGEEHSVANGAGTHRIVLPPYGYRWYRVGGLDYILQRSDF